MCRGSSPGIQPMAKLATVNGSRRTGKKALTARIAKTMLTARNTQATPPYNTVRPITCSHLGRVGVGRGARGPGLVGRQAGRAGRTEVMERLSGLDASFLYLETPSLHMHVGLTLVFDPATVPGGYSFERMKRSIEARLPSAPVFRRRLVEVPFRLGHPVWVDDADFDIDYHVRLAAVPKPGGLRQLADLAGDITGRQLDRARPLWEMWIVEGLAGGRIGFIAKMHHSTVDGVSGAALLAVLFDLEPEPAADTLPPEQPVDPRVPSGLELMSQAVVARTLRPIDITLDLFRTGQRVLNVRRIRLAPRNRAPQSKAALPLSAPRTSFNGALTWRRSVALTAVGLDDVKRLKNATGSTVNDVVLAVCTGALRSFLLEGDELPAKPLVAVVPVSVRADMDDPQGLEPGLDHVRPAPGRNGRTPRPSPGHPRRHQGSQGGARGTGAGHAHQLGRARHAQFLRQRRPGSTRGCGWPTGTGPSPTW